MRGSVYGKWDIKCGMFLKVFQLIRMLVCNRDADPVRNDKGHGDVGFTIAVKTAPLVSSNLLDGNETVQCLTSCRKHVRNAIRPFGRNPTQSAKRVE